MAELTGREGAIPRARAARCTCSRKEKHFYGGHGIVGAQVPLGAGSGLRRQVQGNDNVTFTYFGDGAANQGQVYETYNMAELWELPVIFVIENNQYAMGTAVKRSTKSTTLSARHRLWHPGRTGRRHGRAGGEGGGREGRGALPRGKGPYILEVMTYRYRGHSMSDPAKYRTREEVQKMREKHDAIEHVRELLAQGGLAEDDLKAIDKRDQGASSTRRPNSPRKPRAGAGRALDRHLR
jgi:pyruvate dehydrogenase E1 component alpha subunit